MAEPRAVLWAHLEKFSPLKIRLLAHRPAKNSNNNCRALTDAEIAIASGLSLDRVREIARLLDWDTVTLGEMKAYFDACGFDPTIYTHRKRIHDYENVCLKRQRRPFLWLHHSPVYEEELLPLVQILNASLSRNQHVA